MTQVVGCCHHEQIEPGKYGYGWDGMSLYMFCCWNTYGISMVFTEHSSAKCFAQSREVGLVFSILLHSQCPFPS